MKASLIKVKGDVQGVSYRYHAEKEAKKMGLSGWAKNEHDGSVTIFAQGGDAVVEQMIAWAKEGSPMATVEAVEYEDVECQPEIKGFSVK